MEQDTFCYRKDDFTNYTTTTLTIDNNNDDFRFVLGSALSVLLRATEVQEECHERERERERENETVLGRFGRKESETVKEK